MSAVFCDAIATDRTEIDPTAALRNVLKPVVSTPRAAIVDPTGIAGPLRAIDGFSGQPLSAQAVAILRGIHPLTGAGRFVFPSLRSGKRMSENTVNAVLRCLGFSKDEMTATA